MVNLNPSIDTSKISLKYLLTTLVVMVILAFAFTKIVNPKLVIRDSSGKQTGEGEISFSFKNFKK